MHTPILFLIFNRPETTKRVFVAIRDVKPSKLYIAADGPREGNSSDAQLCAEAKNMIDIDWDCEVHTLYRQANLGCKQAVSSAISWFFEHEEMGIILEDDCLPDRSFFSFCSVMLDRYKDDLRINHIGGTNFQNNVRFGDGDYYYSHLTHVWGWASWRRVWKLYDVNMLSWPNIKKQQYLKYIFPDSNTVRFLEFVFDQTFEGKLNTWDYQLFFANLINGGLSIIPNRNLVSNIGFGENATHTFKKDSNANIRTESIDGFNSPTFFIPAYKADLNTLSKSRLGVKLRLKNILRHGLSLLEPK